MSNYGRLWEHAAQIRWKLEAMFPDADISTPAKVRTALGKARVTKEVDDMLVRWEYWLGEMAATDD